MTAEAAGKATDPHGRIGLLGATALVMGAMIGSGVYLLPATLGAVGSISILGWLAATAAALAVAGVFVWLGPLVPGATGLAGYVHGPGGRRWVLVAIANHPRASAIRPAIQALVEWTARQP